MTSEFWIGVFVGVITVTAIEFLIALMWAITARSSQISREEEALSLEETKYEIGKAFLPTMKEFSEDIGDILDHQKKYGRPDPRPEPIPPDHDVKSS